VERGYDLGSGPMEHVRKGPVLGSRFSVPSSQLVLGFTVGKERWCLPEIIKLSAGPTTSQPALTVAFF